ncbi:ent-kaur-16-ene synthase, chloroplastic [Zea mays]|uniref:Uncharacterized protein n=1 Tax=Zea mays TaxID=4577 RepID=A0A804RG07_MAIZE|nr:ent-kaur-16-ene synthase, chloroplastic [Zea mays]|eukprot:XP_020401688.1 ent-kaur-16-ene synthase, chloroplastic [Zea mays]
MSTVWCSSVLSATATSVPKNPSRSNPSNHLRFTFSNSSAKSSCHRFSSCRSNRPPPLYYWACIESRRRISCGVQTTAQSGTRVVERNASLEIEERHARIRKQLLKPELSPSAYDTAWVAMVPSPGSPQAPCFPQCVQWILENQLDNGSWGHNEVDSSADKKETILATLACVIALKKWDVGPAHITKGIQFIARNFQTVTDEQIVVPIGFDFTFSGMFTLAINMGLQFPVRQTDIDGILRLRENELKRYDGDKSTAIEAYCAYVAEGFENLLDWNDVMKFQAKNGSLFNSPSATAAALVANYDDKALQYLNLLVTQFGSAVPTVFPQNIHCQLSMVDTLESVGISRHFSAEIKAVLDMVYSLWLQKEEEIMLDAETCAMAFRILQMNGYDVSTDWLSHIAEASNFHNSLQGYLCDTKTLLEMYKASKVILSERDLTLENIGCWTGSLLREKLCSDGAQRVPILEEVEYALKFPHYAIVDPLNNRRSIEHLDARGSQTLKTKYLPCHVSQDILALAVEDFCFSQSIYQDELQNIISWEKENRMDQLQFVRQRLAYCYLAAATTISPHELSDARVACAKSIMLTVVVDDFFDVGGSKEEQENLIELVENWDEHHKVEFCSEKVEIVFYAVYNTVNQLGSMASAVQKRDVTKHLAETWLKVMLCMLTEADWQRRQFVPTVEEYMANAVSSLALAVIILPAQYFLGETLSDYMVKDHEYSNLSELMFTCSRLLNDIRSVEREFEAGKLNSVSLLALHSGGSMSIEAAKKETHGSLESYRRGLVALVRRQDSVVPRSCKELFWKLCKTIHLFYFQIDGFTSPKEMVGAVNQVINEPLELQSSNTHV